MVDADFTRILAAGRTVDEKELEHRLSTAFREAREADLVFEIADRVGGVHSIGIGSQWWDLVWEELRGEGRWISRWPTSRGSKGRGFWNLEVV